MSVLDGADHDPDWYLGYGAVRWLAASSTVLETACSPRFSVKGQQTHSNVSRTAAELFSGRVLAGDAKFVMITCMITCIM